VTTDPLLEQLVAGFVDESQEIRDRVSRQIFALEKAEAVGGESFDELARGLHTLKGSSATLGLSELADLAHRMEEVVLPLSGAAGPLPPDVADTLLRVLDAWMARLRAVAAKSETLPDLAEPIALLDRLGGAPQAARAAPAAPQAAQPAAAGDETTWRVGTRRVLALMREVERLRELRLRIEERRREMERGLARLSRLGMPAETAETRAQLMGTSSAVALDGEEVSDIIASMEEGLKAISTLPVSTVLEPLRRTVRDLCRHSGKEAELTVTGAELSLDRRVLEALQGPLAHLVRNAIDHGLELPAEREAKGKPREGALLLEVRQQGNTVSIELSDDGSGLDAERIREVALRKGIAPAEELSAMATAQIHQLVFRPGFTTREEANEISGRGVGLDAVRNQVQALRGAVEVHSAPGRGTRFVLTMPAEMGTSPVVVVRCGEHRLGIPMVAVQSSRSARSLDLEVRRTRVQLKHGEQLVPVRDLGALLGFRQPEAPAEGQPLLILQWEESTLALGVDEVEGDRELVIRPLPVELRPVSAFQGAATLARGELVLIVRPEWLFTLEKRGDVTLTGTRRALVVDDSLTARALHRTALESGGYLVHTASDAHQALEQLRHSAYDVMVCDIGMPEMDGFQLTSAVRARRDFDTMPIILVSARESEAEGQRGAQAGADGFLSKRDCVSGRLVSEVGAAIARRKARA
jgi:chemotaxis protein histidine kinase CheA/ActR/RegA family two-component response regulator